MDTYKKFFIQQHQYDGSSYTNVGDVVETNARWNVVCQEFPFKHLPEPKDLPERDWNDENGKDVFIPSDGIKFNAYEVEAKFLYVGQKVNIASDLKSFIDFIYGRINIVNGSVVNNANTKKNVFLKIYDEYTETGRRCVYPKSVDDDLYVSNDYNIKAIAQFKVKFRVTDPVYSVSHTVSNNKDVLS